MNYPAENPRGRELFSILEERMKEERYDDEFLLLLIEYREMYPESEHFDIFYGRYAAFHGNYELALGHAKRAYKKRKTCRVVWKLLTHCYTAMGHPERAIPFQSYEYKMYRHPFRITLPVDQTEECLGKMTVAMGTGNFAPFCEMRAFSDEGKLNMEMGVFSGEFLPLPCDEEGYSYWVGAYNELTYKGAHGTLLADDSASKNFIGTFGADFVFDIMRSKVTRDTVIDPKNGPMILPIAGTRAEVKADAESTVEATAKKQWVSFRTDDFTNGAWLGQWEYSFFRIDQPTQISSSEPLAVGKPISLGHNSQRKRLVLNILVDSLNWKGFCQDEFQLVPHITNFFSKGIIFREHFSVSEYTYPSIPTIETGRYPHRSQVFRPEPVVQLDEEDITMSERMRDLGYYCVNVMGSGDPIYNGATRGYDRLLVNAYDLSAYGGVERTIRQMEAFSECDQFLFLHLMEAHCGANVRFPASMETQTKTPLKDRAENIDAPSVFLPRSPFYQRMNRDGIRRIDRSLGNLFEYICSHFHEDEYLVQLYSDHGNPVYDDALGVVNDGQTHALYMLRGDGVPLLGMVDELTSSADIYPSLAKLAGFPVGDRVDGNLPAALGGRERECVYSNSLFPGQTYKLAIRTKEYECYMESRNLVDDDGTVDLSGAEMFICRRDASRQPVEDPALEKYFLGLARDYGESVNHGGRQWRSLREARK